MIKTLKKVILSCFSILLLTCLVWIVLLLNPTLLYANLSNFNQFTVFHNEELDEEIKHIIIDALAIIKQSDIYDKKLNIQLCLNDDKLYPKLYPFAGATAYAFLNKTVIYDCKPKFKLNRAEYNWERYNYELRNFDLTWLLAHEFTHNLQNHFDLNYVIKTTLGKINWKLEGHAEYISREFKNDGKLLDKIEIYETEIAKKNNDSATYILADGTHQMYSYYKYALVVQYLFEVKKLNYKQLLEHQSDLEDIFTEMIEWKKTINNM